MAVQSKVHSSVTPQTTSTNRSSTFLERINNCIRDLWKQFMNGFNWIWRFFCCIKESPQQPLPPTSSPASAPPPTSDPASSSTSSSPLRDRASRKIVRPLRVPKFRLPLQPSSSDCAPSASPPRSPSKRTEHKENRTTPGAPLSGISPTSLHVFLDELSQDLLEPNFAKAMVVLRTNDDPNRNEVLLCETIHASSGMKARQDFVQTFSETLTKTISAHTSHSQPKTSSSLSLTFMTRFNPAHPSMPNPKYASDRVYLRSALLSDTLNTSKEEGSIYSVVNEEGTYQYIKANFFCNLKKGDANSIKLQAFAKDK